MLSIADDFDQNKEGERRYKSSDRFSSVGKMAGNGVTGIFKGLNFVGVTT